MIRWNCNFNIPDSTIQVSSVFIKVDSFRQEGESCDVVFNLVDDNGLVIKTYNRTINAICRDEEDIYKIEVKEYNDSVII